MNDEIKTNGEQNSVAMDILAHYGMPRRSGRYPYGSGDDPYQHNGDFLSRIYELKDTGWTETAENIKEAFGMTTSEYRAKKSIAISDRRALEVDRAKALAKDGLSPTEIGRIMGRNESSIRSLLNEESAKRTSAARETADFLKKQIDEKGMIDVGAGVEAELKISREKLNQALDILKEEGYPVYKGGIPEATNPGQQINQMVVCPPGTAHKDIYEYDKVNTINDYITRDDGQTFEPKFHYPESLDSSRLKVLLADDISTDGRPAREKDGLVEIRPGVEDLSLGESRYAQVRILVDGNKYIKGMAVYNENLPEGIDVVFNTSKSSMSKALKDIKDDPENPFGSAIKDIHQGGQYWYTDENGEKKLGLINKRADEGDWMDWKDKLPSQFLGKQSLQMAKKQLELSMADKDEEYDSLISLNNPTVKKQMLMSFAEDCDSAAIHLQAAALPGQKYHVIIPVNSLSDTEVYAPNYENGTKLALVRYPHGGTFEIPIVTVNNKNKAAIDILGTDASDAIGINAKVAERLSGADFDGDTVMCIPTHDSKGRVKVTSTNPLKGLEGFDNKAKYGYDGEPVVDAEGNKHYYRNGKEFQIMRNTGTEMGKISNLITDMTLKGASEEELAAAVRHSMVVIDAEKHKLDYKASEKENNIAYLRKTYQHRVDEDGTEHDGGASTLLSRAKGQATVLKRQGSPHINQEGKPWYDPTKPEGALVYKTTDNLEYQVTKVNARTGEVKTITKQRTEKSSQMAEATDARSLISEKNTPMEQLYAEYANHMKNLANQARIDIVNAGNLAYSPAAAKTYEAEVNSLKEKLRESQLNSPKERRANALTASEVKAKKRSNPDMTKEEEKKLNQRTLTKYRSLLGASRKNIDITTREWEAIQAGAISENRLSQILRHSDKDRLRQLATPRANSTLSQAKINKARAMKNSNYTLSEIAKALGVSPSTISSYLKGN